MSQQCCSYIRLVASKASQYEVVAFETKDDIKYIDVRPALHCCMWNTFAGTEILTILS